MGIQIFNATEDDIEDILTVENSWPEESRASKEVLLERMRKFPLGFLIARIDSIPVATITSCMIHYDPNNPHKLGNWRAVTNDGRLFDQNDKSQFNSMYIVSGVIDESHRGTEDIFSPMVLRIHELAESLGMKYTLAGAILPGYGQYVEKQGFIPAADYAFTRKGSRIIDPLIAMYESIGFCIPSPDHVIEDYYEDHASLNCSAIVVKESAAFRDS